MSILRLAIVFLLSLLKSQRQLILENLALKQQVATLRRSVKRPRVTAADKIFWILFSRYVHGTHYRDGTTQVAFEPVDFIARLAALVQKPRVNLTRYHGVLAPNHRWRGLVTPGRRARVPSVSPAGT